MTHFPYRVVVDPNVLIAAAISRDENSPVRLILQAATEGRIALIACPHLWDELVNVLARPKIRRRLPGPDCDRFTTALRLLATEAADPVDVPRVVTDAGDDYLIALARRESVHTLITGDKAVLAAPAPDLLIQTPRQFIDRLSATR